MKQNLELISGLLSAKIGLNTDALGEKSLERSVLSSVKEYKIDNTFEFLGLLETDKSFFDKFVESIIVPETWFFRDSQPFNYLNKYISSKYNFTQNYDKIKILSYPCSTGEEAYSIAISLIEAGIDPSKFKVDALDISSASIDFAKNAVYRKSSFRGTYNFNIESYFSKSGDLFKLDDRIKNLVRFSTGNLISDKFNVFNEIYDVIFCKNLLIYLTKNARNIAFKNIRKLLKNLGLIFTGHTEVLLFQNAGFTLVKEPRVFACTKAEDVQNTKIEIIVKPVVKPVKSNSEYITKNENPKKFFNENHKIIIENVTRKSSNDIIEKITELSDRGLLSEAKLLCSSLISNEPYNASAFYLFGLISEAEGDLKVAEENYIKAVYLDPIHYNSLVHIGLLYQKAGDNQKADLYFDRAKRCME